MRNKHSFSLNLDYGKFTKIKSEREEFNKILKLIRITLNHNKVSFKGKTGVISGFAAGSSYPQIWLRDANTIIPASCYFYESLFLRSWLEEHLSLQKKNGELFDWVDAQGKFDKNTTETDQEASAIQSAHQITSFSGPAWLNNKIRGELIINRLEKALLFVSDQRFDKRLGLITGAHTADWGDVDIAYPDQRAIKVNSQTHWTCDIYDQSMFFKASQNLAEMFAMLGEKEKAVFWLEKAELIQKNTERWLWQEDKGFYRIHVHLDSLQHDFDEDDMFAMGGNTEAILSGLASEKKCRRIIECALQRQKSFGLPTISGVLLPPYPKNFFRHQMMDDPYEYQNGGQWDWFGGKLVLAMFEHGFSRLAKEKLLEIIRKNLANGGLFEWDSREGIGQGSDFYSGSAGSLARALFEGYLGIKVTKGSLHIEPKLGQDNAAIHIYIPASDLYVAYDYRYDREKNKIFFEYNSNFPEAGQIKILNPWSTPGESSKKSFIQVRKDGIKIPFSKEKLNNDEFILIGTDFCRHILKITREDE